MTEMHLRICAIMAVLLLVGPQSLGQTSSGSPYVHLADLESERPLRFGTQKQLLLDNEVLCAWYNLKRVAGCPSETSRKSPARSGRGLGGNGPEELRNPVGHCHL